MKAPSPGVVIDSEDDSSAARVCEAHDGVDQLLDEPRLQVARRATARTGVRITLEVEGLALKRAGRCPVGDLLQRIAQRIEFQFEFLAQMSSPRRQKLFKNSAALGCRSAGPSRGGMASTGSQRDKQVRVALEPMDPPSRNAISPAWRNEAESNCSAALARTIVISGGWLALRLPRLREVAVDLVV